MDVVQSEGQNTVDPKVAGQAVVRDVICAGCADLCDDLQLNIEQDRIIGINVDCQGAQEFFLDYRVEQGTPMVRGSEVGWDEALEEAANVLTHAKYPLIEGLSATACEAQRRAVEVAELLGGCLDVPYVAFYGSRALANRHLSQ